MLYPTMAVAKGVSYRYLLLAAGQTPLTPAYLFPRGQTGQAQDKMALGLEAAVNT